MATFDYDVRNPRYAGGLRQDNDSFEIFSKYRPMIYRICLGVLRKPADAEDATQETLIKVWENMESFRGEGRIEGWIYRIAKNCSLAMIRDRKNKKKRVPEALLDYGDEILSECMAAPDRCDPHEMYKRDLRSAAIGTALGGLEGREKDILLFYAGQDTRGKERALADYLGKTRSGAKNEIYRARLIFLQQLTKKIIKRAKKPTNDRTRNHDAPSSDECVIDEFGIPTKFFAELDHFLKTSVGKKFL